MFGVLVFIPYKGNEHTSKQHETITAILIRWGLLRLAPIITLCYQF